MINKNLNEREKKDFFILYIGIILIISLAIICFAIYKINNIKEAPNSKQEVVKADLKYTETNNKIKEGIYITDVSEVVENVMPSIVAITSKTLISSGYFGFNTNKYTEGAGSGIIISKTDTELLILTNNHVVDDSESLSVQFIDGECYDATIKGVSERKDVAIISLPLKNINSETLEKIRIATIGDSNELKVGNGIIAIGNALGYGQSVTTGVVSALNREINTNNFTNKMIQIDAAINGGNSGGALLNNKGEVVGINSAKYSSTGTSSSASIEGMGFAIPISDISELIVTLMNGENDISPTIGIEGYIISEQYSKNYDIPKGFYITKITEGSGASKSNLSIGNIITKINDQEINDLSDIQNILYTKKKGEKITLTVSYVSGKSYKEKVVKVTLS